MVPDVRIDVYADTHGAPKQLGDTEKALDGLEKGASVANGTMGGLWKQFAIGQLAVAALKKAYDLLKGVVEDSIKNALAQEKADVALQAAIEITGRTVEGNLQHYLDFAAAQMKYTTYTDDEIEASQALLLQLTNLDQNGIDRATKGSMGLATTMGMDLHSATVMVTKAMEGNYGALGRVGIKVAENLTAEQKQASLLDQLDKLYQRSTAETDTFGGALKQLKNSWGEALETTGMAILKNEKAKEAIKNLKEWIDKVASSPEFQDFLKDAVAGLIKAAEFAGKFANAVITIYDKCITTNKAQRELNTTYDAFHKSIRLAIDGGRDYEAEMKAATDAAAKNKKAINETGTAVHGLTAEQIKAAAEAKKMKDELEKSAKAILDKYNPLRAAMKKVLDEESLLTKAFHAGAISEAQYRIGMAASEKELRKFGSTIISTAIPAYNRMQAVAAKAVVTMAAGPPKVTKAWGVAAKQWVLKNQESFSQILDAASSVVGQIEGILQQSATNRMAILDQEYQARLALIENSKMNEEEKEAAITALDAQYSMKRRAMEVQNAQQAKVVAIANAIINVALGVTKALSALPPPFNLILAAITAAAGAVQIALIRSQPIGAAAGAIFKRKALLMSQNTGQEYEVAEGGEAEIVSSPRQLRQAILGKDERSGRTISLTVPIYIGANLIKKEIITIVEEAGQLGRLRIAGRAVA